VKFVECTFLNFPNHVRLLNDKTHPLLQRWSALHLLSKSNQTTFSLAASIWGICLLGSAFILLRSFKLVHIIQTATSSTAYATTMSSQIKATIKVVWIMDIITESFSV